MFLLQIPCMASLLGEAFSSTSKMTQSFQCTISPQKTEEEKEFVRFWNTFEKLCG